MKARTLVWIGFAHLVAAIRRGQVEEVWVGDSNAVHFASATFPRHTIGSTEPGRWVWSLGPRIMFSIARDGYPPALHRMLRLLRHVRGSRDILWVFSTGEIDLRCHLVPRLKEGVEDLGYVRTYVERVRNLVAEFDPPYAAVSVPIPPAVDITDPSLPIVGTLQERLDAHRLMRKRMHEETGPATGATGPVIHAFDATDRLSDAEGHYRPEVAFDGIHPNDYGRSEIREVVAEFRRALSSGGGT